MDPLNPLRPMEFGEILATGWRLTRRTIPTAGLLTLIISVGLALLMVPFLREFMLGISNIILDPAMHVAEPDPDVIMRHIMPMMGSMIVFGLVAFLAFFLALFTQTATTIASWDAMNDEETSLGDLIKRSLRRPYWYVLAQAVIMYAFVSLANIVVAIVGTILAAVTMGIGYILLQFVYQVALIYFVIATIFRIHQVVIGDRGPWQGMIASIALVKDNWWRTFGVMFVIVVILSIILIPVMLPIFIPMIGEFMQLAEMSQGQEPDPAAVATAFTNIANSISPFWIVLVAIVSSAMTLLTINTITAMYVDLRARRGDFLTDEDDDLQVTMVS